MRQLPSNLTATTLDIGYELSARLAVKNETGSSAYLTGFVDANNDGDFTDPGETKALIVPSAAGYAAQTLTFTPSLQITKPTSTWTAIMPVRFRLSTLSGLTAAGPAPDGEVEDYQVTVSFSVGEWWPQISNNPVYDYNADIGTPLPFNSTKLPPFFNQTNDQTWRIGLTTLQGLNPILGTSFLQALGSGVHSYSVSAQFGPQLLGSHAGFIKISDLSVFRGYMGQYLLTGPTASPHEDSDGDGNSNFAEFIFGTDPSTKNQPPSFAPKIVNDTGNNYFTLPYLRRSGGAESGAAYETPNARYLPEASADLIQWTVPLVHVPAPSGQPTPPSGYEWGAVRIPGGGRGFVRLNVIVP